MRDSWPNASPVCPCFRRARRVIARKPYGYINTVMNYDDAMKPTSILPLPNPSLIPAGGACRAATEEFLLARLANPNTRLSYARACAGFAAWLSQRGLKVESVRAPDVALYARDLERRRAPMTVAQHLSALRRWYDWLVERGVVGVSPARSTRTPRPRVEVGSTPVLTPDEIARLYAGFGAGVVEARDRALVSLMLYGFLRVGAALAVRRADVVLDPPRAAIRVREKGGTQRSLPLHAQAAADLRAYLAIAHFEDAQPLFIAWRDGGQQRGERPLRREQVYAMVRRRLARAGIARVAGCHAFRATGITRFLSQGGRIETAAHLAGHASLRTTQLYDHRARDSVGDELACLSFAREIGGAGTVPGKDGITAPDQ